MDADAAGDDADTPRAGRHRPAADDNGDDAENAEDPVPKRRRKRADDEDADADAHDDGNGDGPTVINGPKAGSSRRHHEDGGDSGGEGRNSTLDGHKDPTFPTLDTKDNRRDNDAFGLPNGRVVRISVPSP